MLLSVLSTPQFAATSSACASRDQPMREPAQLACAEGLDLEGALPDQVPALAGGLPDDPSAERRAASPDEVVIHLDQVPQTDGFGARVGRGV